MKLYLAGIKSYQLDLGIDCKTFSDPRLERMIQGIKRDYYEPERSIRTPLTGLYLLEILSSLTPAYYQDRVLCEAFTLAVAGFLRFGEFTDKEADLTLGSGFGKSFPTKASIRLSHGDTYMEFTLRASKTDPFRKGIKLTITSTGDLAGLVRAMERLQATDTHRPQHAPRFCIGQHEQKAFTREYVVQKLQELAIIAEHGH